MIRKRTPSIINLLFKITDEPICLPSLYRRTWMVLSFLWLCQTSAGGFLYGNGLRSKVSLFEVEVGLNTTGDRVRSQGVVPSVKWCKLSLYCS